MQPIERRIERFENRMTAIEQLPARIDGLYERLDALTTQVGGLATRVESLPTHADVLVALDNVKRELIERIEERSHEVMNHARALHEDAIQRIKIMGEGNAGRRRKR